MVIERKTRMSFIVKLERKNSSEIVKALKNLNLSIRNLTNGNAANFADWKKFCKFRFITLVRILLEKRKILKDI